MQLHYYLATIETQSFLFIERPGQRSMDFFAIERDCKSMAAQTGELINDQFQVFPFSGQLVIGIESGYNQYSGFFFLDSDGTMSKLLATSSIELVEHGDFEEFIQAITDEH